MRSPSPMLSPMGVARVERRVRVLEDDLHPAPVGPEGGAREAGDVPAVEQDRSRRGVDEPQQQPAHGGLAAARLADQPERLAAPDDEVHAVHGLDLGDRPLEHAALDRERLGEPAQLHERRRPSAPARRCPRAGAGTSVVMRRPPRRWLARRADPRAPRARAPRRVPPGVPPRATCRDRAGGCHRRGGTASSAPGGRSCRRAAPGGAPWRARCCARRATRSGARTGSPPAAR